MVGSEGEGRGGEAGRGGMEREEAGEREEQKANKGSLVGEEEGVA